MQKKKGTKRNYKNNPKIINKIVIATYLSIMTLNVNGLKVPVKRHRVAEWLNKQDLYILPTRDSLGSKDIHRMKVRGWKRLFHANGNEKKNWGGNTNFKQNRF